MGTNFYCIPKCERKNSLKNISNDLINYIEKNDFINNDEVDRYIEAMKSCLPKEIHLGKRSAGWQFLWDFNNWKYYKDNLDSIKEFLKDKIIYNEYGEQFTIDEFFNKEIDYCLYKKDNLLNGSEGEYANQYHYNDGLRFSKYTDFS